MSAKNLIQIQTENGPILGCKKQSILARDYFSFQRIPYMKAPIGKLRFVDPQMPEKWTEPLDCTKEGPAFCNMNFLSNQFEGELNGVHINVYTNNVDPRKPFPVMMWIHPGGIMTGNTTDEMTGVDYFMQKNVVIVTFNYRIGVFGFLSLNDPELNIPGNAQFRDQIAALNWVKNNIANFGGDPNNVTLFGESWGGGASSYHMIFEKSKNLFHRAILMSGCAIHYAYSTIPRRNWALRLCKKLGYSGSEDEKSLLEFLENADEKEIVIASGHILTDDEKNEEAFIFPFGPSIEPYDKGNALITDEMIKMTKNSWGNEIDILIGNTSNECLMVPVSIQTQEALDGFKSFQRFVPRELNVPINTEKRLEYAAMLKKNYYGSLEPTLTNLDGIAQGLNDNFLWHPMYRLILSRLTNGKGKSFGYRFDYVTKNNLFREFFKTDEKIPEAAHGDDVGYLFRLKRLEGENFSLPINSLAFDGIKLMVEMWTKFASTGNPNVSQLKDVEWTPATIESPFYGLNISEKGSEMMNFPEAQRIKIYDEIFARENKTLY